MKNAEIERSLRDCESFFQNFQKTNSKIPKIQDLLTKAILIEICASFNEEVESLLKKKLLVISEESIREFAYSYIKAEGKSLDFKYKHTKKLIEILEEKLPIIPNGLIRDFANSCIESELQKQNPRYCHIKGLVNKFGNNYGKKLEREIKNQNHEIVDAYDSLFNNRNHAAHSRSIDVTLKEVKEYYEKAHLILDCLQSTLET